MATRIDGSTASAILLSVTTAVGAFTTLLPPLADVRKSSHSDVEAVKDIRTAEGAASVLVIAIGVIASSVVKNPGPAIASIVAAVGLVLLYESILKTH